ncbi:hypothetical protein, partial [uncultured Ruegeria sp.]|uniref:hypothetical protein n=1 Tax=uncultured Ruegeria sp. TaxID=259304 RepID=UPI002605CA73
FIGSSVHRFIGSSVHRFIGSEPSLRPGADSSTYRLNHPYILTPGLRPTITHGLTRSSLAAVTRAVAVRGLGSDVVPSHFNPLAQTTRTQHR